MNNTARIGIVVVLLVVVGVTLAIKQKNKASAARETPTPSQALLSSTPPITEAANNDTLRVLGGSTATAPTPSASALKGSISEPAAAATAPAANAALPKLVDLGAGKCIPCKKMAPILEQLKKDYAGRMDVQFIDVWQNPRAGEPYGIRMIPTQIFFDAAGAERFRHEGFFSREDILAKWKELGVDVERQPAAKQ